LFFDGPLRKVVKRPRDGYSRIGVDHSDNQ
jgi:hypothetical protein